MSINFSKVDKKESLDFHRKAKRGKVETALIKPLNTAKDLALAYSPGVGFPCLEIHEDPEKIYEYTSKGNFVAVISNGTAVLGFGNLGHLASKPVMEGKSALFKRFADIDSVDILVKTTDVQEFITTVKNIGDTWGGINLEDIGAPECFDIEIELRKLLDIPVFHDDQHGTAIITLAAAINAAEITGRNLSEMKIVSSGAGAAGLSCMDLLKQYGVRDENIVLCDQHGVIYEGRDKGMNKWKAKHAAKTNLRTLGEALNGADMFVGLSVEGAVTGEMLRNMAPNPIIFAMANPNPEITPEEVAKVRPDAIVATGRSDYPNQVNNVMGFPYIFRGALDVRARTINDKMKIAAALAIASLAKEPVPEEVKSAYPGRNLDFGKEYIIPTPFDPRLIVKVSSAVARAAVETGVARIEISNWNEYEESLRGKLTNSNSVTEMAIQATGDRQLVAIFAEGEELQSIMAAINWVESERGGAILVGVEKKIHETVALSGISLPEGIEIINASNSLEKIPFYTQLLYDKNKRKGLTLRDCERLVKTDRNIFASVLLENEVGNIMITGLTRSHDEAMEKISRVIDVEEEEMATMGVSVVVHKNRKIFILNTMTALNTSSSTEESLAYYTVKLANFVQQLGLDPRVAFVGGMDFHSPESEDDKIAKGAIDLLKDGYEVPFEVDGVMTPATALNANILRNNFSFSDLKEDANILVVVNAQAAQIMTSFAKGISDCTVIGPLMFGLQKVVQFASVNASADEVVNLALMAGAILAVQEEESAYEEEYSDVDVDGLNVKDGLDQATTRHH